MLKPTLINAALTTRRTAICERNFFAFSWDFRFGIRRLGYAERTLAVRSWVVCSIWHTSESSLYRPISLVNSYDMTTRRHWKTDHCARSDCSNTIPARCGLVTRLSASSPGPATPRSSGASTRTVAGSVALGQQQAVIAGVLD